MATGSDWRSWRGGGARSVSPEFSRGVGHRGGRRGRGRGRWAAVNGGPRFASAGAGLYPFADFGKLINFGTLRTVLIAQLSSVSVTFEQARCVVNKPFLSQNPHLSIKQENL